jgi:hypothetical protein
MRLSRLAVFGLVFLAAACASGSGGGGGGEEASGVTQDRNLITAADLLPYGGSITAYEAVRRLRRFWVQGSGGRSPRVFVNEREMGGATTLEEYNADQVLEMKFIASNDAMTQFGPDYAGGVIQVTLR